MNVTCSDLTCDDIYVVAVPNDLDVVDNTPSSPDVIASALFFDEYCCEV